MADMACDVLNWVRFADQGELAAEVLRLLTVASASNASHVLSMLDMPPSDEVWREHFEAEEVALMAWREASPLARTFVGVTDA